MFLAWNEIKKNKKKFILIINIIVLISYLTFFLLGLAYGLAKDNTTAIELWNAKQIVLSEGSNSNLLASRINYSEIKNFDKETASPINISRNTVYLNDDKEKNINISIIGVDYNSKIAPLLVEGNMPKEMYDVVATIDFKLENKAKVGDTIKLAQSDTKFKICGFSKSGKFSVAPVIYTNLYVNSLSTKTKNSKIKKEIITDINKKPKIINGIVLTEKYKGSLNEDLELITIKKLIKAIPGYIPQVLTFSLMIGFLVFISAIILGVFLYILTIQKKTIFGIMKIQGISNFYIYKSVILQTLILVFIGVGTGLLLTYITGALLPIAVPFKSNTTYFILIGITIVVTSLIGVIFSIISVSKVDPLEALE